MPLVDRPLTACDQTTPPETERRALRLSKRDSIHESSRPSGEWVLNRAATSEAILCSGSPFGFLARDIANHPEYPLALNPNQWLNSAPRRSTWNAAHNPTPADAPN